MKEDQEKEQEQGDNKEGIKYNKEEEGGRSPIAAINCCPETFPEKQTRAEGHTWRKLETNTEANSRPHTDTITEESTRPHTNTNTEGNTRNQTETNTEGRARPQAERNTEAQTKYQTETNIEGKTNTNIPTERNTNIPTETNTERFASLGTEEGFRQTQEPAAASQRKEVRVNAVLQIDKNDLRPLIQWYRKYCPLSISMLCSG